MDTANHEHSLNMIENIHPKVLPLMKGSRNIVSVQSFTGKPDTIAADQSSTTVLLLTLPCFASAMLHRGHLCLTCLVQDDHIKIAGKEENLTEQAMY